MSGSLELFTAGQAAVIQDQARLAAAAAAGDDLAMQAILTPRNTALKVVIPLVDEALTNPQYLVFPATGGGQGKVSLGYAQLIAATGLPLIALSGIASSVPLTALIAANASGVTRYDLVYAVIQRTVSTTGSRVVKDPTTLQKSTQTLNLENQVLVTLGVVANVASGNPLASLPADAGGAYYFGLAMVTVANGYAAGGVINQDSSGGTTYLTPLWQRGWVHRQRVQGRRVLTLNGTGGAQDASAKLRNDRWGSTNGRSYVAFKHVAGTGTVVIDDGTVIDWRKRAIRVSGARPAAAGGLYKSPELVTVGGQSAQFDSQWGYTGTDGTVSVTSGTMNGIGGGGGNVKFDFFADNASGALKVTVTAAGGPADGANGDNWSWFVDAEDQFDVVT